MEELKEERFQDVISGPLSLENKEEVFNVFFNAVEDKKKTLKETGNLPLFFLLFSLDKETNAINLDGVIPVSIEKDVSGGEEYKTILRHPKLFSQCLEHTKLCLLKAGIMHLKSKQSANEWLEILEPHLRKSAIDDLKDLMEDALAHGAEEEV